MDADSRKIPSHEVTYARLRDMILFGHLAPGAPVTIQGLITDLGAGMTPVREAIRRLTAEGALLPQGNRRVAVPELSPEMLEQVAFARLALEPKPAEPAGPRPAPSPVARSGARRRGSCLRRFTARVWASSICTSAQSGPSGGSPSRAPSSFGGHRSKGSWDSRARHCCEVQSMRARSLHYCRSCRRIRQLFETGPGLPGSRRRVPADPRGRRRAPNRQGLRSRV